MVVHDPEFVSTLDRKDQIRDLLTKLNVCTFSNQFSQVLPVGVKLNSHDLHEPGEGAEVGLDAGVPEGEVGEVHHRVPPHLPALVTGTSGGVGPVLNLQTLALP